MKRLTHVVVACFLVALFSANATAQPPTFTTPAGLVLNYVKSNRTGDFELVMDFVRRALQASADEVRQAQGAGWSLFRVAAMVDDDTVLYVWIVSPAVSQAAYSIEDILREGFPARADELYGAYEASMSDGGQIVLDLNPIGDFTNVNAGVMRPSRAPSTATAAPSPAAPPRGWTSARQSPPRPTTQQSRAASVDANTAAIIKRFCTAQWPNDFRMQEYCENQQSDAVINTLSKGAPSDVPNGTFQTIRSQCVQQWADDFRMREYCENQQIQSYRRLR